MSNAISNAETDEEVHIKCECSEQRTAVQASYGDGSGNQTEEWRAKKHQLGVYPGTTGNTDTPVEARQEDYDIPKRPEWQLPTCGTLNREKAISKVVRVGVYNTR